MIIVALALTWMFKAQILSTILSRRPDLSITLESLELGRRSVQLNKVRAEDRRIGTTLTFHSINIETDLFKILNPVVVIDRIELNKVNVVNNVSNLNFNSLTSLFLSERKKEPPPPPEAEQRFIVKELSANHVDLVVENPISERPILKASIPSLNVRNLGEGEPITLEQIIRAIARQAEQNKS